MTKHREEKVSLWQKLNAHLDNIAFYQTIFSLPFAYMAVLLASKGTVDWWTMLWVTMTIVSARSAALALDNMIDLKYEYEVEGFEMKGIRYLPDFYIPSLDRWFEIKAKPLSEYEMKKCEEFCFNKDNENIKLMRILSFPF